MQRTTDTNPYPQNKNKTKQNKNPGTGVAKQKRISHNREQLYQNCKSAYDTQTSLDLISTEDTC